MKRFLAGVGLLLLVAGVGFWMRPVSYFNASLYAGEALSGIESHTVTVAGHSVHYLVQGPANGPVVVLVHGLGGRAEDWTALAAQLSKSGLRVYRPELLGYGRSERPAVFSYAVRDEAVVVVGFLDAVGLKQVDLGGWSMGGWIAALVASEHPERVRRLMLFDAAGIYQKPDWDTRLFTPTTTGELHQLQELLTPHPLPIPGFVARDILREFSYKGWVIERAVASMLTGRDTLDNLLPHMQMPVLLVWGSLDRITPLSQGQTMRRLLPHGQLEIFPSCGHLAAGECAGAVGPKVIEFLKGQ